MTVALILLISLVVVGTLLYLHHRFTARYVDKPLIEVVIEEAPDDSMGIPKSDSEVCCGMHITCEKDSLVAGIDRELLYYEDEELDRFCGRAAGEYTEVEVEEFREVLLTLQPDEIAGWARSLTVRGITLPAIVKDELLLIVAETRNNRTLKTRKEEAIA
ncbi:MAG: phospholipase [Muribaculaceae bacterium]|nr:phospholipase [Muribaculaceae bacterium]